MINEFMFWVSMHSFNNKKYDRKNEEFNFEESPLIDRSVKFIQIVRKQFESSELQNESIPNINELSFNAV